MRKLLLSLTLIGLSIFTMCGHAETVIKIATLTPDGSAWMKLMRASSETIAQRTANRVTFKFYPGGVMGDDKAVLRKVRIGQLQGAAMTTGALEGVYADGEIYNLPLLFNSFDEVDYVRKKMDAKLIAGFAEKGLVTFGFAEGGFAYPMTKGDAIRAPSDFGRHKVWVPNDDTMGAVSLSTINITPIPLALGDVLTGLQTSLVDTIAAPPVPTLVMQWHTQVKNLTEIPLSYIYAVLFVDKKVFDKVSPADQAIVREEMTKMFAVLDQQNRKDTLGAYQALQQQGIQVIKPSADEHIAWQKLGADAQQKLLEKGVVSRDTYNQLQKHLANYRAGARAH